MLFVLVMLLFASPETIGDPRLRITDVKTAALIEVGLEASVTLRGLIAEIESGDVIVHVDRERFMPGRQTGRMRFVSRAGTRRYVRVSIRAELPPHRFIAAIAHELQHVSEVIRNPEVRDAASLEHLYRRIGHEYRRRDRPAFETDAALRVAAEVRREINTGTLSRTKNVTTTSRQGARKP
jgi:hypothetical protein